MKIMRLWAVIACVLWCVSGCRTFAVPADAPAGASCLVPMSEKDLAVANDPAAGREARCRAIFGLFANRVKAGMDSKAVFDALMNPNWLDRTQVRPCQFASKLPVDRNRGLVYCMALFADDEGWSNWVIYFVLDDYSSTDGLTFLKGGCAGVGLIEFALCFPEGPGRRSGRIERFNSKGSPSWVLK